ncbi:MAG: helix-turn-helix domain-containing protein [Rhodobacteraceae bacterium]|nr:helix-turn-helix domain-containing protein [Paracoccaceae bacterium]
MKFLDIGTVAEQSGLPPSALRYYEEIGLIVPVGRHGLRRQYGPDVLVRLALITLGRTAGFSLAEVAAMFGKEGRLDLPRAEIAARVDAIDRQIAELRALRNALRHVADCPAPSHLECPSFQRFLRGAGRAVARPPRRGGNRRGGA